MSRSSWPGSDVIPPRFPACVEVFPHVYVGERVLRMTSYGDLFFHDFEYVKGATPVLVVSLWLDRSYVSFA